MHFKIVLIFITLFFSLNINAAEQPVLTHGLTEIKAKPVAPALSFNSLDDEIVDLKKLQGKVVLINYWATWCPPCRREMGSLERLYQSTKDKGVVVLAVNVGEDEDTVFSFLGEVDPSPTFPILFDIQASSLNDWGVKGLPTTYVVDGKGRVRYRAIGGREFDHPELVKKLLGIR